MTISVAMVLSIGILAAVILCALFKMGYVRAALSFYRMSFELEATDNRKSLSLMQRRKRSR
jgi:hypothetical protein